MMVWGVVLGDVTKVAIALFYSAGRVRVVSEDSEFLERVHLQFRTVELVQLEDERISSRNLGPLLDGDSYALKKAFQLSKYGKVKRDLWMAIARGLQGFCQNS